MAGAPERAAENLDKPGNIFIYFRNNSCAAFLLMLPNPLFFFFQIQVLFFDIVGGKEKKAVVAHQLVKKNQHLFRVRCFGNANNAFAAVLQNKSFWSNFTHCFP